MSTGARGPEALPHPPHHRAELAFALASFAVALGLAAAWPWQTVWIEGRPPLRQPGLFPGVAIGLMLVFGAGNLAACLIRNARRRGAPMLPELARWLAAGEFLGWYLAYVLAVPWLGYLPATVLFTTLLALRLGYRGRMLWAAPLFGAGTVILFKTLLKVRIPGGALYDLAPPALRTALVLWL